MRCSRGKVSKTLADLTLPDVAFARSYGTLCSDFKQSGFDTPERPSKEKAADDAAKKSKGKSKAKEEKSKSKKKKPKGLFAIDWFRIGALRGALRLKVMLTIAAHSPRRGAPHQVANDAQRKSQLCSQGRTSLGTDRHSDCQVRPALRDCAADGADRVDFASRLEDLYSLLHFIQLEPWGPFAAALASDCR